MYSKIYSQSKLSQGTLNCYSKLRSMRHILHSWEILACYAMHIGMSACPLFVCLL